MPYKEITERYYIPRDDKTIWRYMDFEKLQYLIENRSLYFARTDRFDEYYEGVLTIFDKNFLENLFRRDHPDNWQAKKEGFIDSFEELKPRTYISCWADTENERMHLWNTFSSLRNGIAIKSNVNFFKESINNSKIDDDVYISKVRYIDPIGGTVEHFNHLSVFTRKITDFRVENEIRGLIQRSREEDNPSHIDLDIEPEQLIERIYVGPLSEDGFIDEVNRLLENNNLNIHVFNSEIEMG